MEHLLAKVNMTTYEVGSSHLVEVTHINDPRSFYIRLVDYKKDVQLLEEKGAPISSADAKVGEQVIFKSEVIGKYVRGNIESISFRESSFTCRMLAIDYGCRENQVAEKHIYLQKHDTPCKPLAEQCQLYLCEPQGAEFDEEALEAMKFFVGTHTAEITIKAKKMEKLVVELRTAEAPEDVSTMLGFLDFTTRTAGIQEVSSLDQASGQGSEVIKYKYRELNVGDILDVRMLYSDTSVSFYVADSNDHKKVLKQAREFFDYCLSQKNADVVAAAADGRCCGARVNQKFERAIVKKIFKENEPSAVVKLVDMGREKLVPFYDIKPVESPMFTTTPAVAIYCEASGDDTWDNVNEDFLEHGFLFRIEIMELGNDDDIPHKVNLSS